MNWPERIILCLLFILMSLNVGCAQHRDVKPANVRYEKRLPRPEQHFSWFGTRKK